MKCPYCNAAMASWDHGICPACNLRCGCSFSPTSDCDYCSIHRPKREIALSAPDKG